MIKFDKDVHGALKTLENAGFETYAIGDCIRDWAVGLTPFDWDMVTTATIDDMKALFPQGDVISKDRGIIRLDFTKEVPGEEEDAPPTVEGAVCDIRTLEGTIEEELAKFPFTAEAMADNPERKWLDPYDGYNDIKVKLVRTTGEPDKMFKENPVLMMAAVRHVAELDFDLQKDVYEAITANWRLLLNEKYIPGIRGELERILTGSFAGRGLNMMADTGLMATVVGEEVSRKMSASEMQMFTGLCAGIDKTKPVRLRRLGLLYTCFEKRRGLAAIERMCFDDNTKAHLDDAMREILKIQFIGNPKDFKRYLFEHGMERYEYIHNLNKAQRIVYDSPSTKIESRNHMMNEIRCNKEPVFPEDLVIDGNDLMEAGIVDTPERAEEVLGYVVAVVHENPKNNVRKYLMKIAKKFARSTFSVKTRYIKWLR